MSPTRIEEDKKEEEVEEEEICKSIEIPILTLSIDSVASERVLFGNGASE